MHPSNIHDIKRMNRAGELAAHYDIDKRKRKELNAP
jgi:hypothetical protein